MWNNSVIELKLKMVPQIPAIANPNPSAQAAKRHMTKENS